MHGYQAAEGCTWKFASHLCSVKYKGIQKIQIPSCCTRLQGSLHPVHLMKASWVKQSGHFLVCGITEQDNSCGGMLPVQETLEHGGKACRCGQMNKSHIQFMTFNRTVCVLPVPSVCQKI